jgi:curved DNA-binding protein
MEFKDYYKIMGISPDVSTGDIKNAYRKLARKYHPDVSKEKDAEVRFKEMKEAYEVLKDPEKRAAYDKLRKGGWQAGEQFRRPSGWQYANDFTGDGFSQANPEDFSDFFSELFGNRGFGTQAGPRTGRARQQAVRGKDMHHTITITLEETYNGTTRSLQLSTPGQVKEKSRTLNVKIPSGVMEGQEIRLREQGSAGMGGAPNGDLYLKIHIQQHSLFQFDKRDITLTLPITPWEAALGATITVPTLGGKLEVKFPADSQTGKKLRLKGRGLPGKIPGDQYIILQIMTPSASTEADKALYKQMAEQMPFNPRLHLE